MPQSAVIHEEFVYTGHNAVINAVCYNRLQGCFVSSDDASLRLWQPFAGNSDLRQVALPPRTSNFIQAIEFVDSRQIYVASALDGSLKIYDLELNEVTSVFAGRSVILSIVFDSKHSKLFTGGIDGCGAWCVRGKPLLGPEIVLNPQYDLAAAPGFFHRATGANADGSPTRSSFVSPAPPPTAPPVAVVRTAFAAITKAPATMPVALAPSTKKKAIKPNEIGWVHSMQLNKEQTRLYAQGKHQVDVFSTIDGHHVDTFRDLFPQENGAITCFVLHEKTQYIVCGCINGYIVVLSVHPTSIVHVFKDHTLAVTGLVVHVSSNLIISSSLDGTVRLWDLEARRQAHRMDVRQPVHSIGILTPNANPCKFYCRVRCAVLLFTIRSAAKEHLSSLSPISILQRVLFPTAATTHAHDTVIPGEKLASTRHIALHLPTTDESSASEVDSEATIVNDRKQWIVAAGTDRTIRLFTGRTANEAPSYTWIPEEHALDVSGFALHPVGNKLFMLLDSQKILIADIQKRTTDENEDKDEGQGRSRRQHRVIDMDAAPSLLLHPAQSSLPQARHHGTKAAAIAAAAATTATTPYKATTSNSSSSGVNTASSATLRGPIRSICCCHYPPIFRSAAPPSVTSVGDATAQLKWFSRTFVNRRQQSKRDLKKLDELSSSSSSSTSPPQRTAGAAAAGAAGGGSQPLIQSDRQWIVCGSEYGHLVFWHSGLTNSFQEAISLDAHDASIVAISASACSPLLVSLDASKRVHIWQFQPVFTLRQMVELNDQPTCFVLSLTCELLLTGYEDGSVVLMNVGDSLDHVETFAGHDESHDAMVSAGDFLDAKQIVLTASVDAVVKLWSHEKQLLRKIQIAMPLTCLCFMNDDGDVMAGVATGIFMLSKDDLLLPEMLTTAENTKPKKVPFWLAGDDKEEPSPGTTKPVAMAASSQKEKEVLPPPQHSSVALEQKKSTSNTVELKDEEEEREMPCEPRVEADESSNANANATSPKAVGAGGGGGWKKRNYQQSLALLMGGATTSTGTDAGAAGSPPSLSKPAMASLLPPVLRGPVEKTAPASGGKSNQLMRATPPTGASTCTTTTVSATRPPSSRPTAMAVAKDPDWREIIMPLSPYQHLMRQESSRRSKERPRRDSPHHRQTKASASTIAELKALAHGGSLSSSSSSSRPPPSASSTALPSSELDKRSEHDPAKPNPLLGIGKLAADESKPMQYCKHQAPVPHVAKTPRKLWNAIGGEDRRLIAVQRNLPSI